MKKLIIHSVFILFIVMSWTSYAQNDQINGYKIEDDEVVFSFDKRDYLLATHDFHGDRIAFEDLDIETVVVAGEFNDWSKHNWHMIKVDENRYELRKKLVDFTEEFSWEFKFIINNQYWAEPTENMGNITPAKNRKGKNLYVYNLKIYQAHISENGNASFKLNGFENANKVILSGSFNKWDEKLFKMNKTEDGWELTLQINPNEYQYKFIVDGNWIIDPNNPSKTKNEHGGYNSVVNIKVYKTFSLEGFTDADNVILAGSFNDWSEDGQKMTKTENGWNCSVLLSGGKHHYKFIVDGQWILDPKNSVKEYDNKGHVNSVCMVKN